MTKTSESPVPYDEFGMRIKLLRVQRKVTAGWVAQEAQITRRGLHLIESGKVCPSSNTLANLADVFGVTMDELWRGAEKS